MLGCRQCEDYVQYALPSQIKTANYPDPLTPTTGIRIVCACCHDMRAAVYAEEQAEDEDGHLVKVTQTKRKAPARDLAVGAAKRSKQAPILTIGGGSSGEIDDDDDDNELILVWQGVYLVGMPGCDPFVVPA